MLVEGPEMGPGAGDQERDLVLVDQNGAGASGWTKERTWYWWRDQERMVLVEGPGKGTWTWWRDHGKDLVLVEPGKAPGTGGGTRKGTWCLWIVEGSGKGPGTGIGNREETWDLVVDRPGTGGEGTWGPGPFTNTRPLHQYQVPSPIPGPFTNT